MSSIQKSIVFTEVAPRDGLQNEPVTVPTEEKIKLINALSCTGVDEVEVTAFVSPDWVPQLADAEEVAKAIRRKEGVTYSALVPNRKGLDRALSCGMRKIALFTASSETFNRKNINASIEQSFQRFKGVLKKAKEEKIAVRGYISTAFHCPYEGKISPQKTVEVARRLLDMGVDELSIGDTTGQATIEDVRALLAILLEETSADRVSLHLHDTYGLAIANALIAWQEFGIYRFDASAGGLGGCPYAEGAGGNVATEDLAFALKALGAPVHVDIACVIQAVEPLTGMIKRTLLSRLSLVHRKPPKTFGFT